MMRFEPRLLIDAETAGLIESTFMPLLESPTVIMTGANPFALAAEIVGDEVHVRAAADAWRFTMRTLLCQTL